MLKSFKLVAAASVMALLLTGLTYAATRPVPAIQPHVAVQTEAADISLSGDTQAVDQALQAPSPVKYKVLVVDSTDGEDKTAYLERVAKEWGYPNGDGLLLVVFKQDNYDVRFYMGSIFREHGVTPDEVLGMVRSTYLPKARSGDAAGGLTALMDAVNGRISGVTAHATASIGGEAPATATAPAAAKAPTTAAAPGNSKPQAPAPAKAPLKTQPAATPAPTTTPASADPAQTAIGKSLLSSYLTAFKSADVPEAERLSDFRFNLSDLTPTDASADRIRFQVKFDVLPASTHASAWLAGNGHQEQNGWMVGNNVIMTAVKQGTSWRLDSFATK